MSMQPPQGPPPGPPPGGWQPGPGSRPNPQPGPHQSGPQQPRPPQQGQPQPGYPPQGPPAGQQQLGGPNQFAPPAQQGPKPNRKKLIIVIVAVVVALVLVAATVLIVQEVQKRRAEQRRVDALTAATQKAEGAVTSYLNALSEADAETALSLASEPTEGTLLTEEVLTASNENGGVSDPQITGSQLVQLEDDTVPHGTVTATYQVGGTPLKEPVTFEVVNSPDGWRLAQVAATVDVDTGTKKINGQDVSETTVLAFPGTYQVAATSDRLRFTNEGFTVSDPAATDLSWSAASELTDAGRRAVVDAGRRSLDACLSKKELAPAGCPMITWRESNGIDIEESTIEYTLENDPWARPELTLGGTQVLAVIETEISLYADATQNGSSGYVEDTQTKQTILTADISAPEVKVTWGM